MVWLCYEERKFGSCKKGYRNEHGTNKRKNKEVIGCDLEWYEDCWCGRSG